MFKIGLKFKVELAETSFFFIICDLIVMQHGHVTLVLFQPLEFLISSGRVHLINHTK